MEVTVDVQLEGSTIGLTKDVGGPRPLPGALVHIRCCHVLLRLGAEETALWVRLVEERNEDFLHVVELENLSTQLRESDTLLVLTAADAGLSVPDAAVLSCPVDVMQVPRGLNEEQTRELVAWVSRLGQVALERQALRRLVDRFEARIRRESGSVRMADLLKEANLRLQEQFVRDALTGVANRRRFEEYIDELWGRAVGEEASIAVLMLDIDFFKRLNDSLGHQEGDRCLKEVAACMQTVVDGSEDLLARYGGEEFVVLLWNARTENACEVAERLRRAVQALGLPNPGHPLGTVTISIGIAVEYPTFESSAEAFLRHADAALYRSKEEGRNRWTLHEGTVANAP